MAIERLPPGLGLSGGSLFFTEETMPDSLRREHALPAQHWAVLHAFEGSVTFVDLQADADRIIPAPDHIIIHPEVPHLLTGEGSFRCRMDFFREPDPDLHMRTPGANADEPVHDSLERCEANGSFAEVFYNTFLKASSEIAPYFASDRLRKAEDVAAGLGVHDGVSPCHGAGDAGVAGEVRGGAQPEQPECAANPL